MKYMRTALSKNDWRMIDVLLNKANNTDIYVINGMVERETRLSEIAIKEGNEKRNEAED